MKNILSDMTSTDMEEKKQKSKEIKVRLHRIDRRSCTEIWEVQTDKGQPRRYLGRDDGFGPKEWYTLCGAPPYGYCERDRRVRKDITIIVCDKEWNEVLRDGMDKERFPKSFPSLDEVCNEAWGEVLKKTKKTFSYVTLHGFGEWILKQSFQPLNQTEEANWRHCYYEKIEEEILSRFTWIGEEYAVFKVTQQHTKCDARWYEYHFGKIHREEYEGYTRFFAYEYSERHIGDVLRTLGKRYDEICHAVVETRNGNYGHSMSYFMEEFVGYDLSYSQICDAKEFRLQKAREDYNEANTYYYKLKENEETIRGIEAMLFSMRKQIYKTKK